MVIKVGRYCFTRLWLLTKERDEAMVKYKAKGKMKFYVGFFTTAQLNCRINKTGASHQHTVFNLF